MGALSRHISAPNGDFQPMNANFGILPAPEKNIRDKKERYRYYAERALAATNEYVRQLQEKNII
jgi:methylenetetrahydrofolate--tRNA-(uracil-5-)-methyltransferase